MSTSSSAISAIFGEASSADVDQNIANIFGKSTGPIDNNSLLANKKRTVLSKRKAEETVQEEVSTEKSEKKVEPPKKKAKKDDENADLEANYLSKLMDDEEEEEEQEQEQEQESKEEHSEQKDEEETVSDEDGEESKPKKQRITAAKSVDLKKEELEKAETTVFVGNLPSKIIDSKPLNKKFKQLFETFGKVKSMRFRSIAFTDNLPRKVAFIHKKLDQNIDSVNAYVVFEKKQDSLKAMTLNGSIFQEHHIRVDHLTHPLKQDNQRSIFVGNLDFQEKEENLWKYFESKVGAGEVENVRIIRDSKTNFGKGFAIVQFKDFSVVNKLLLLNDKPLTTSDKQRKLRITRCKKMEKQRSASSGSSISKSRNLSEKEKTLIGRGKKILNKSDRNTIGRTVIEGERATKGVRVKGIKNGLGKVKKPRIRDRSTNFKKSAKKEQSKK